MANVILKPDRFTSIPSALIKSEIGKTSDAQASVRRPTGGLELKPDRYGSLRVVTAAGSAQRLINTSAPNAVGDLSAPYTTNLIIQSVQESREEKSQIIQTFGADFVYFFGERPVQIQISAQLIDANNFRWHQEWWENYRLSLRGTELVRKDARAYLEVDDVMYEGYITSASTQRSADTYNNVALTFTLLVTNKVYLRELVNSYAVGDAQAISAVDLEAASQLAAALSANPSPGQLIQLGNVTRSAQEIANSLSSIAEVMSYYDQFPSEYVSRDGFKATAANAAPPSDRKIEAGVSELSTSSTSDIARGGIAPETLATAASTPIAPIAAALTQSAARGSDSPAGPSAVPVAQAVTSQLLTEPTSSSVVGSMPITVRLPEAF